MYIELHKPCNTFIHFIFEYFVQRSATLDGSHLP